jgi:hypothetical protein
MRKLFLTLCLLSSVLCPLVRAAEPLELAPGLPYLRIHSLEKSALELNAALNLNKSPALVLDLRYVADERDAADVINSLNSHPAKPMLYILVSPETPKDVAAVISATSTRLVTLGIRNSRPQPRVVVEQTAADDRAAYAALDHGTALAALVSGKVEKEHFDEAVLVKEFNNGNHDAHPPEGNPDATKSTTPLTDRVLQRALHLHQALQALKR